MAYDEVMMKGTKPLTIEFIDVDNDCELDALMIQVLAEGDKVYQAQREESLRLGIIDEKGRLLLDGLASGGDTPLTPDFWRELKKDAAQILARKKRPRKRRSAR